MALEFKLPDIGEGIAEGEIVKWLVKVGDQVDEHQSVVEVMTDKATVEVPAPAAGTITEVRAKEGDVVPVGSVLFVLDTEGGAGGGGAPAAESAPAEKKEQPGPTEASAPAGDSTPAPQPAAAQGGGSGGGRLEFKLPDIGEGIAEGEIVKWLVQVGDQVDEHQSVVEVMTDKATVEVPAPAAGTITELRAEEGAVVPVGSVLFVLEKAGGAADAPAPAAPAEDAPAADGGAAAPAAQPAAGATATATAPAPPKRTNGRVLAVPSARRVARELGIDLGEVPGSGRSGVIRRADVEAFAKARESGAAAPAAAAAPARPAAPAVALPPGERETRVAFRGIRRKIAEAMARSKYTAPHFTVVEELDVTELVRVRAEAKAIGAEEGIKVTYMPFIMKAVANCLATFPELNSSLDESTQELVTYQYVNLGIATDTKNGLIVPVIREVQSKGILQLASELADLAERTRAGKVQPDELKGSTFTITNAGNIGGTLATPIINFPEVGILGVHRIQKKPGVVETPEGDRIEVRHYMNLSISVDHRLVDGASAARFLVRMRRLLESPGLLAL